MKRIAPATDFDTDGPTRTTVLKSVLNKGLVQCDHFARDILRYYSDWIRPFRSVHANNEARRGHLMVSIRLADGPRGDKVLMLGRHQFHPPPQATLHFPVLRLHPPRLKRKI